MSAPNYAVLIPSLEYCYKGVSHSRYISMRADAETKFAESNDSVGSRTSRALRIDDD